MQKSKGICHILLKLDFFFLQKAIIYLFNGLSSAFKDLFSVVDSERKIPWCY